MCNVAYLRITVSVYGVKEPIFHHVLFPVLKKKKTFRVEKKRTHEILLLDAFI